MDPRPAPTPVGGGNRSTLWIVLAVGVVAMIGVIALVLILNREPSEESSPPTTRIPPRPEVLTGSPALCDDYASVLRIRATMDDLAKREDALKRAAIAEWATALDDIGTALTPLTGPEGRALDVLRGEGPTRRLDVGPDALTEARRESNAEVQAFELVAEVIEPACGSSTRRGVPVAEPYSVLCRSVSRLERLAGAADAINAAMRPVRNAAVRLLHDEVTLLEQVASASTPERIEDAVLTLRSNGNQVDGTFEIDNDALDAVTSYVAPACA